MTRDCKSCIYYDKCIHDVLCDDYYTIDEEIKEMIEYERDTEERASFREEWFEYIEQFYD